MKRMIWLALSTMIFSVSPAFAADRQHQVNEIAKRVTTVWDTYSQPAIDKIRHTYPEDRYGIARVVVVMTPVVLHPPQQPFSKVVEMRKEIAQTPNGNQVEIYAVRETESTGWSIAQIDKEWKIGTLQVKENGMKWHTDMKTTASEKELERILLDFNPPCSHGVKGSTFAIPIPERKEPKGIAFTGSRAAVFFIILKLFLARYQNSYTLTIHHPDLRAAP